MTNKTVFDFNNYFAYLSFTLEGPKARGMKSKLAAYIQIQPTYLSQILQEKAHLSLEQAESANQFFRHTPQESHFFLILVQKGRAGTKSLKDYFQNQIDEIQKSRMILTERLEKVEAVTAEERNWYYSSWLHSAIHIAVTIPKLQTAESLSRAFHISETKTIEVLDKLASIGLINKSGLRYEPNIHRIRLGRDHHAILMHHSNWRLQAIQSLDHESDLDLHYSGVVSLSNEDARAIKDLFFESIQRAQNLIRDSKEERLSVINIDFFDLLPADRDK